MMANELNIKEVVEIFLKEIEKASDESFVRKDLIMKIATISEKEELHISKVWYVETMNKLLSIRSSHLTPDLLSKLIIFIRHEVSVQYKNQLSKEKVCSIYLKVLK